MGTAALGNRPEANGGGTALVPWTGPLDLETVAAFEKQLDPYLRDPSRTIILDLRRVEYIDSAGLRFLLALRERMAEARDRIVLMVSGESRVERTMRLVGFDQLFEITRRPADGRRHPEGHSVPRRGG
jgi:anti-anti-sigma factor